MGISVSISCDHLVPPILRYLCWNNLEDNLEALQKELASLSTMRDDLMRLVSKAEDRGLQMLPEVERWISRVGKIESEANRLLDVRIFVIQRLSMCGCCSLLSASTYRYSQNVDMTLKKVKTLRSERFSHVVPERAPSMTKMPAVQLGGYQVMLFERTWHLLMETNIRIVGIYGMGGVGKTTILDNIKKKFLKDVFDPVIFVVVASTDVVNIQDEIGRILGLQWGRETEHEKAAEIFRVLKRKRFILLLDDIRRRFRLHEIGVPLLVNGCKIVFTTRSKELCREKWVDASVKVDCLPPNDGWDLFKNIVGETTLRSHPDIPALARIVAVKCLGLPLALKVIGKSMAGKKTIHEWRHAIHILNSSVPMFSGLEDPFLPILKFSYDILPGDKAKSCFLYCALFPQGVDIRRQDLVNYWVVEGLVSDDIKGYSIISDLVRASLLVENESGYGLKMHDVVREMALWIASDCGRQREFFVVSGGYMPEINDWKTVRRMSMASTQIVNIPDSPNCPELTTLFLQHNNLKRISGGFFRWMASLVVMDLSHNRNLSELPEEVSGLLSLRLLNLSWTSIKDLPKSFGELRKLIHLDLESTPNLRNISQISGFLKLQVLRFYGSASALDISLLKNLERLEDLQLLTISVREVDVLKAFFRSRLPGCTQRLYLEGLQVSGVSGRSFAATFGDLGSLRNVEMVNCNIIESEMEWEDYRKQQYSPSISSSQITPRDPWFMNLSTMVLLSCHHLKDLTWLIYAANLESLSVKSSPKMEEVISEEKAAGISVEPFLKLQILRLENLYELKSIYWSSLSFPRLRKVHIKECSNLHKLPLNSTSVERIDELDIEVDGRWLDRTEWESNAAQDRFLPVMRKASASKLLPGNKAANKK